MTMEVDLGSHCWMGCLAGELLLNSCFFRTLYFRDFSRTAVEKASCGVHKLLGTGGVPLPRSLPPPPPTLTRSLPPYV